MYLKKDCRLLNFYTIVLALGSGEGGGGVHVCLSYKVDESE